MEEPTLDALTGNEIRPTDNSLKDGDFEAPQHNRPLTEEEIAELLVDAQGGGQDVIS